MKQIKLVNPENVPEQEAEKYNIRNAARAIVIDEKGLVALLHSTIKQYYKLPGGGIEAGESPEIALKRECMEEIGCHVEIINELGSTVEYRKKYRLKQTSYCYIAKLVGEKGKPNLEPDEIDEGFETVWLSLENAIELVKEAYSSDYDGPYMQMRDSALLESAGEKIK